MTERLPHIPWRVFLAESVFIVVVALIAAWDFTDLSALTKLNGLEMEFLTSSAHTAALGLRAEGHIPLWQPFLGEGRPLLESPFAFILNPISVGPTLWLGSGIRGIKLSVVLYALVAAGGGWFMGYAFGLRSTGRVLMALLMLGKGNMIAILGVGHFQLAVAQAYMPYIFGATYLILRGHCRRWSVVLLALAVTLQFTAGNIWHLLPTLLSIAVLTIVFVIRNPHTGRTIEWAAVRRLLIAGCITVGLSAAVLVPIWANRAFIGGHDPVANGDVYAPVLAQLRQYVTRANLITDLGLTYGEIQSRYNYTVPWWLLLIALVPLGSKNLSGKRRLYIIAGMLFVGFTVWGIGGLQPYRWLYNHVPGLGRWRFVGRAYGTASVWLALLVALRIDSIWGWLCASAKQWVRPMAIGLYTVAVAAGLTVTLYNWREWVATVSTSEPNTVCLAWIYAQGVDQPLTVYQGGYSYITAFLNASVRQTPIEAAYRPLPVLYTLYEGDLRKESLPTYAMPVRQGDIEQLQTLGYTPVETAPFYTNVDPFTNEPVQWRCAWARQDALFYAYQVPVNTVQGATTPPSSDQITSLRVLQQGYEFIAVQARGTGGARSVVVVEQVAYPGWQVWIDGERVPLEPVGGFLGAMLPLSTDAHAVVFIYRPRLVYISLWVTVISAGLCILALLHVDRLWRRRSF